MYLQENIQLAIEGLKSNKMRALLTMLGIIIGIGSVIAIVSVGDSMTASVSDSMQKMGVTNIMVSLQEKDSENDGPRLEAASGVAENDLITEEMLERYQEVHGRSVEAVSLSSSGGSGKAKDGRLYANVTVTGVNDGYGQSNNIKMLNGRFIKDADVKSSRYAAVVSDKLVSNMFPGGEDPLGQEIKISSNDSIQTYTIVGVYKYEQVSFGLGGASSSDKDVRTNLYIPITTCNMIISADKGYQQITVMAAAGVDTDKFAKDTADFFNVYYKDNSRYEVSATSMESMMTSMTSMLGTLSIAIAVIAAISLVVGGVGVMNIMLVSVTERTREIGTRKALGARSSSIRVQFIVEAVIICGIGGVIGIVTGVSLGYIASLLLGFPSYPNISIIIIAVLFSMLIGVFFGYYPANKAATLDPIDALRYE